MFNRVIAITAGLIVATAVYIACTAYARADWNVDAMNQQIDQTNFLVNKGCSGTLIDKANGFILTANHCMGGQFEDVTRDEIGADGHVNSVKVRVSHPGTVTQIAFSGANEQQRTVYVFHVKATDASVDLALLKVDAQLHNAIQAPVACKAPRRGETVYSVGNPFVVLYATVTKGIVASVARDYRTIGVDTDAEGNDIADNALTQHTAPIEGGNSGGALYNDKGELVGVNVRASQINETLAFAVPLTDVRKFLADNGVTLPTCQ